MDGGVDEAAAGADEEMTAGDAPAGDAPTTDAPTTDVPTSDAPTTDAPTTDAPAGDAQDAPGQSETAEVTMKDEPDGEKEPTVKVEKVSVPRATAQC